ncbi:ABC transporter permease [Nocardia seriolae]|uniref:ABC transporter permease n=1 Tax=Nocardia seriolae TaxID=37332 RepID=UPI0008FF1F7F|nr:ABC transporter permease subunit [Nocardia seriolae]OJF79016.1 sulfonate ABC transporter permease [Nocardia seriolae]PSK27058.1 sulfonate ABC transporter permease [Nocardia seriolae]QOW30697.1 ABC transporter permease subunit [Nocardia seriolae]QUN15375.1 ABC transporter permease subunit [Nocardia seriolae]WNJ57633.1 ABC transporter permease subunit [Nocardia seriolae]
MTLEITISNSPKTSPDGRRARGGLRPADYLLLTAGVVLTVLVVRLFRDISVPWVPGDSPGVVSTDPVNLPYYAARTTLRMFVGLVASVIFTLVVGQWAAHSRRAEKVLIPMLDILQSVPVLALVSITVTAFIAMFPGSYLGAEAACMFAIFTAMAWNMTFAYYQALRNLPRELDETTRMMRLTRWQRLTQLEIPAAMIPMIWNGMMSFGGAWFMLASSEIISVSGNDQALPGMGSFIAAATSEAAVGKLLLGALVMIATIVLVNVLFWRPFTAWSERFRVEHTEAAQAPRSLVLDLLRRTTIPARVAARLRPVGEGIDRGMRIFGRADRSPYEQRGSLAGDEVFFAALFAALGWGAWALARYFERTVGFAEFGPAALMGLASLTRVVVLLVVSTVVWVPVGVWIGMNPRICRFAQPVVQVMASFPAQFLYIFVVAGLTYTGISLNVGGTVLMALGAQWYILFNVIAAAGQIPTDLREAMDDLRVHGRERWKSLILPAIAPGYVVGAITAFGGAWNATLVGEVVDSGNTHLEAFGLGAYITEATTNDQFAKVLLGTLVMSVVTVAINRLLWRRLQRKAETRFALI